MGPRSDDEDEPGEELKELKLETAKIAYELLRQERTILVSELVTPKLTERITTQLLWLDSLSNDPIKVFINTPGGSADDGFAIFDIMRFIRSPVVNICVGLNASAGTIVLLAVPRERRLCLPNARIMIHQPSGGSRGRASDIEITAEEILKLRQRANELIAKECNRSREQVERDTDRDHWLSPEEARDYGLVSRIITSYREIK
ncbi:MAG: ATP-dependent Clp protease proteolytic subunit [Planctomycetes bacterium]|nr:ATP-dependent Clp protease proteolytic subunit [Planctomycetota bacterium]